MEYKHLLSNKETHDIGQSIRELDALIIMLDDQVSLQAFSAIGLIKVVFDKFSALLRNMAYTITRATKDLTQSEFMLFFNGNNSKVKRVLALPYEVVKGVTIDTPAGLTTTYEKVTSDVVVTYNVLSMLETSTNALRLFNAVLTDTTDSAVERNLTQVVKKSISNRIKNSAKLVKTNFAKGTTVRAPFNRVFEYEDSLGNTVTNLRSLENRLLNVSSIHKNMKESESICDTLISNLTSGDGDVVELSNGSLKTLSEYVRNIAGIFENYALTLTVHQVIEHNMQYVIKELGASHKIF